MKFRVSLLAVMVFGLLVSTSCFPEFENPLPRSKDMTPDRAILGTWETMPGKEHFQVSFFEKSSGEMYIVWLNLEIEHTPPGVAVFQAYSTSVNKNKFLCLRIIKRINQDSIDKQEKPMFLIARYEISSKGILSVNMSSQSAIKRMIEKNELKGRIENRKYIDKVIVTSSSDELVAAILKNGIGSIISEDDIMKFQRLPHKGNNN